MICNIKKHIGRTNRSFVMLKFEKLGFEDLLIIIILHLIICSAP